MEKLFNSQHKNKNTTHPLEKKFMTVIKMVKQNFNDNHKNFRGREREFSIDFGLCWYGVQKYSGYGVLNDALGKVLARVWYFCFLMR